MTAIATRTARTSSAVAVVQKRPGPIAVRQKTPRAVIAAGLRGAPGRNGVGAGGITYVQDHEPTGATESETWWNPLTLQLKVYHSNQFEPVSPDGGHF